MLKKLALSGCVAVFLFGRPCMAKDQQSVSHTANHASGKNDQPSTPTHVVIDPPFPPYDQPAQSEEKPLPRFARPEWVSVYVTVVYSVITLFMWLAIRRQADTMDQQAKDGRESSGAAAATTQETLNAMREQAMHLERQVKASHDGLRAWIGVGVKEIDYADKAFLNLVERRAFYNMKNYGQTPAFIRAIYISNRAHPIESDGGLVSFSKPILPNRFLGAGISEKHLLTLADDALSQCESGQMVWRFVIKIEYEDVFGQTHETMASFHYYIPPSASSHLERRFYQETGSTTNYNT
jgi:hypothetical protein